MQNIFLSMGEPRKLKITTTFFAAAAGETPARSSISSSTSTTPRRTLKTLWSWSSSSSLLSPTSPDIPLPPPPPPPQKPQLTVQTSLLPPPPKKKTRSKLLRIIRSVYRSLPVLPNPIYPFSGACAALPEAQHLYISGTNVTGTIYGRCRGRISLCIQENPQCIPTVIVELPVQTHRFLRQLNAGMVRVALESEKMKTDKEKKSKSKRPLLEEPHWTMYSDGKKIGCAVTKVPSAEDLHIMEVLTNTTIGVGVVPGISGPIGPDLEWAYMRAQFERIVGSRDSETFYMLSPGPDGFSGPELSVFFVRV